MLFISFIFMPSSSKDGRGAAALGGLEIPHGRQQFKIVLQFEIVLLNTKTRPSKVGDVVTLPGLWKLYLVLWAAFPCA